MATITEALNAAVKLHQGGDLVEAEHIYRDILAANPRQADAWHLLGLVAYQLRRWEEAIDSINRAIELDDRQPSFHNHLAEVYLALGKLAECERCCRHTLQLNQGFALAHNTLGNVLTGQGKTAEAIASFRRAIQLQPDFAQAHCNLGSALRVVGEHSAAVASFRRAIECNAKYAIAYDQLGAALAEQEHVDEAMSAYREALRIDPNLIAAEISLGALLQSQSRLPEAMDCYQRALAIQPNYAEAHCNLGSAYKDQGQPEQAIESYLRALGCSPELAEAHFNLGIVRQEQRDLLAAKACYEEAIRCQPDYAHAYNNLGTIFKLECDLSRAIECYHKALELYPNFAEALNNLGTTFKLQGRHGDALVCYEQTLRIKSDYPQSRYNRALALLGAGDFSAGWQEYEWRWQCPNYVKYRFKQRPWDGSPLRKRVLLVYAEQGLGDTLQFVRYLRLLAQAKETVKCEVPAALLPLLRESGYANLIEKGTPLGDFDLHIPLMSLPLVFRTTLETIPSGVPYLTADPKLIDLWRDKLRARTGFKVGIAWQGSKSYATDLLRSIPLTFFEPLAQAGVDLISLQKGLGVEQLSEIEGKFTVHDLGDTIDQEHGPFMDTAAIMKNLDLVVTSDTAIAHLAGGLGVPVWVVLPLAPDWRWLLDRTDSPWYPTMRLFRQTTLKDWPPVFADVADRLRELASSPRR